jgi:hypothetical protein
MVERAARLGMGSLEGVEDAGGEGGVGFPEAAGHRASLITPGRAAKLR